MKVSHQRSDLKGTVVVEHDRGQGKGWASLDALVEARADNEVGTWYESPAERQVNRGSSDTCLLGRPAAQRHNQRRAQARLRALNHHGRRGAPCSHHDWGPVQRGHSYTRTARCTIADENRQQEGVWLQDTYLSRGEAGESLVRWGSRSVMVGERRDALRWGRGLDRVVEISAADREQRPRWLWWANRPARRRQRVVLKATTGAGQMEGADRCRRQVVWDGRGGVCVCR